MPEREYVAELRRAVAAPPAQVWALVADTNRFERAAGLAAGTYKFRELRDGDECSRVRVASAVQMGVEIEWIEPSAEWIEARSVRTRRKFLKGPLSRAGVTVDLTPDGTGTQLHARAYVASSGFMGFLAGNFMKFRLAAALKKYFAAIEAVLARQAAAACPWDSCEPPATQARETLMLGPVDTVTSGTVSALDESEFAYRAKRFESSPVEPAVRTQLLNHIRTRPDEELGQMRPFEIARAWKLDRRDVLRGFLHAARSGLIDLSWQLNCPTCRVASEVASSLASVGRQAHCDTCNISFDLDFAEHVEAVFRVSPALRQVETAVYCAASPWFRPHVFAQLCLEPGEKREILAVLPNAPLLFRTLAGRRRAHRDAQPITPSSLTISIGDASLDVSDASEPASGSETKVVIENQTVEQIVLLIERSGWSADVVLGSVITTLPDFLDLFSAEAPAAGIELTVGSLTMLFSDLTGSTAMYERLGDARAFAVVQEHFRLMGEAVAERRGAIVKTMGDAVMANFASPLDALNAALDMIEKTERIHGSLGLTVKLGLHEGPCLAVRANDRLDFFGTTVNVAARLQAQAHASEIVILETLMEHSEIARVARDRQLPMRKFDALLKGIRESQHLIAFDARPSEETAAAKKTASE